MSERDTLKATLPPDVYDDMDRLYEKSPDPDPRDILAELHREGLLDAGQLKRAVVAIETQNQIRQISRTPPEGNRPEIMGQLGAGAMGEVMIAKDPGLNRIVAVKRILPEAAKNKSMMRRFYTEAQVTAQLDHPSIVPIHGLVHDENGGLAYAMKLVRGRTLEDFLDEASASPYDEEHSLTARLERFLHVCDAMAYAHERGIVHRDLKPENIMVGAFGEVLVMDWGIAKVLSHGAEDPISEGEPKSGAEPTTNRKGTKIGQVMGTPRYMSPEQAEGQNDIVDGRSDQYALGLILQEVVTLQSAIADDMELPAVLGWAQQGRRNPMKGASRELTAIVDKACSVAIDKRYANVGQFAEDIRRTLRDEAPIAAPDGIFQRIQRWIGRHRRTALLTIVALGSLVLIVGASLMAAAGSALAVQQYQAQQREANLTNVLHRAMDRAQAVDSALHQVEAMTTGIAYAANGAMKAPPPRLPYEVLRQAPPNQHSAGQHGKVSVEYASVGVRGGASVNEVVLERLAGLGSVMTEAMISTRTGDARKLDAAEQAKMLGDNHPVLWSRVGLMEGALATAPGSAKYDGDLPNFRKSEWFTAPKSGKGPVWSGPVLDPAGLGQVVSCSVPWFNDNGGIEGVAEMDVSVAWLQKKIKAIKGADGVWLLDKRGNVVLSTQSDASKKPEGGTLPYPDLADSVTPGRAGWHEGADGKMAVWSPLRATGWTWVVVASADLMKHQAGEAIVTD